MQLDSNIFFRGAALQNQQQQNFLDSLSKGIANYQFGQQMDMKRRQMEADALEKQNDVGALADAGMMKSRMKIPLTPQEQAAMEVWQAKQRPVFDPVTGQMMGAPNIFDSLGINGTKSEANNPVRPQGFNFDQFQPAPLSNEDIPPEFANNPKAKQTYIEETIKSNIANKKKEKEAQAEKDALRPQAEKKLTDYIAQQQGIEQAIDKAIEQTGFASAGLADITSFLGGTPAANLEATLSTIQADSAFDTLQAMRDASKTGGALGQVSERELQLLMNSRAALSQKQSPDQLRENLRKYKNTRKRALDRVKEAYKKDFGELPKMSEPKQKKSLKDMSKEERYQLYLKMKNGSVR